MEIFAYNSQLLVFACCSTLVGSVLFVSRFFWANTLESRQKKSKANEENTPLECVRKKAEKRHSKSKKYSVKEACVCGTNIVWMLCERNIFERVCRKEKRERERLEKERSG